MNSIHMATAFLRNQIIRNVRHFAVFSKDAALFTVRVSYDPMKILEREQYWKHCFDTINNGYNDN